MSLTNDMENVVPQIFPILKGRRLEYIDSEGQRDVVEVDHKTGTFRGFGGPAQS